MKKRLYISLIVIAIVFFLVALSYYTSVGLNNSSNTPKPYK